MSKHNRERKGIKRLVRQGLKLSELSLYAKTRIAKHGKRTLDK